MRARTIGYLAAVLATAFLLWRTGNRPVSEPDTARRLAMDTLVTVKVFGEPTRGAELIDRAFEEIERIDRMMGEGEESELRAIEARADAGWTSMSEEMRIVLSKCQEIARRSDGAFDITIGALKRLWNFRGAEPEVPSPEQIASRLPLVDYRNVLIQDGKIALKRPGMRLDLGAAAKGYAVDRALAVLKAGGARAALVEAGGDVGVLGRKPGRAPWRIPVQHPRDPEHLIFVKDIGLPSVATSGDYERFFERENRRYHHILDPRTGYPADRSISATVWTRRALDADILSTVVFVLGPERGLALIEETADAETLILFRRENEMRHVLSSGLKGKVDL